MQKMVFKSGNEAASMAIKQINYHLFGYYPITPSTQICENVDMMKSQGELDTVMIGAEGEHSAAGICYGGTVAGARVVNATSANGLLYSIEQLPVQSGTRMPMVLNVACRSVSGPLSIKSDHSDIMYTLNCGWIILFAKNNQEVYDFNIVGLKLAERVKLPLIVAYDGFFTSHQKRNMEIFTEDKTVLDFIGENKPAYTVLDMDNPVTIGSYMNEPDLVNNKYQLHLAMEQAKYELENIFKEYEKLSGRKYEIINSYNTEDAEVILFTLGSLFDTAKEVVDALRSENKRVGAVTIQALRPFYKEKLYNACKNAKVIIVVDKQDSYGGNGGNMSLEIKAMLQEYVSNIKVITRIGGIGGLEIFTEEIAGLFNEGFDYLKGENIKAFDYLGAYMGSKPELKQIFEPVTKEKTDLSLTKAEWKNNSYFVKGGSVKDTTVMPKRLAPGHGACPGCGIPVNINLLLRGIEGNVVLLFQTGCGMVVNTSYPKTSFKVNYVHNLFQNGGATLSGILEAYKERVRRGEIPDEDITFIMVSGDGGLDIGLGSALGSAIRNHKMIIFEYDNGGYMNTGYQYSYSTPLGSKSATSHIGPFEYGKGFLQKDNPMIFAATGIPYVATVAESHLSDFIKKARKAQAYTKTYGMAYIKALSACPLNWGDNPRYERKVIDMAVKSCYHPLYEIEQGRTTISYNPENNGDKIPVSQWLEMMGRTKHIDEKISNIIQAEVDKRWERLKNMQNN